MNTDFNTDDCREPNATSFSTDLGEYYGSGSRCFTGKVAAGGYWNTAFCYYSKCNGSALDITIGS